MRNLVTAVVALLTVLLAGGCSVLGRIDSKHVGEHVREMPGVARVEVDYDYTLTGGERFGLTVTLQPDVTEAQVRDIGTYFARATDATELVGNQTDLNLHLPKSPPPPKSSYVQTYHTASFSVGQSSTSNPPTDGDIADGAAAWLRTARAPITSNVLLVAPTWGGDADSRRFTITLRPEVTQAQALALQASDAELAGAEWTVSVATDGDDRPHDYTSIPRPPSDADARTWRDISAFLGPDLAASAHTNVPMLRGDQADTAVEFSLPGGPDTTQDARVAFGVLELIRRFDRPVAVRASSSNNSVKLIVGGCRRRDAKEVPGPLETALSKEFERC